MGESSDEQVAIGDSEAIQKVVPNDSTLLEEVVPEAPGCSSLVLCASGDCFLFLNPHSIDDTKEVISTGRGEM